MHQGYAVGLLLKRYCFQIDSIIHCIHVEGENNAKTLHVCVDTPFFENRKRVAFPNKNECVWVRPKRHHVDGARVCSVFVF